MSRNRRAPAAAFGALLLLAVVALVPLGPAPAGASAAGRGFPTRPTRVLVLGDSVILGAQSALPAALPGREVTMDAVVSRSTGATAAAAAGFGTDWDVVVILVAHNDGGSPGAYQPAYRRILDQFAGVPRIVVLTLHEVRPYYRTVNAFLRGEAAARPNVRVADWNAACSANPGATGGDGLHLTGGGARLLAGLVADQVTEAEIAATPPPTTTTTAPPTTLAPTTTAPTTTTAVAVGLIPATSISRPAPTTTTTSARPVVARSASTASPAEDRPDEQDTPPWVWPLIALVLVAVGTAAHRHRGTLPH